MENTINTIIVDSDQTSRELVGKYLKNIDGVNIQETFDNALDAFYHVTKNEVKLVIIDVSKNTQSAVDIISKITSNFPNIKIIVTSYSTHSELVIKSLRAGAKDFLVKPLIEKEFAQVIERMKELIQGDNKPTTKCKVISVFSNKGGIGKTSLATNVAYEIATLTKEKVALVDLNIHLGDITTFLDINPTFNTNYLINNLDKIDENFLLSSMEKYKNTSLYILADPPDLEHAQAITSKNIENLINVLKETFSYIIIDTTSGFEEGTITALDNSDLILLTTILNVPSIRNCQRCFELFQKSGYKKEKVKIIVNRYLENDDVKIEDAEAVLGHHIYFKIPNNYSTIINAINKGVPVTDVNPLSNIAKSFKDLAGQLSDNITYENTKKSKKDEGLFKFFKNK